MDADISLEDIQSDQFSFLIKRIEMRCNGHLYVVGRSRCNRECQTRRKVGARSDLSDR